MNSYRVILTKNAKHIAEKTDPEDAIRELDVSLQTLDRHMKAMLIARDQLEMKKEALLDLISPLEAETICVI